MRIFWLCIVSLLACGTTAHAYEHRVQQGGDAFIFDFPFAGQSISIYQIDAGEPYSDMMEGMMHDWFIIEDIYKAMSNLPKIPLTMARSGGIGNAFAVIRRSDDARLIVIDPIWLQGNPERIFVIAHELGHHVCGHTAGLMMNRPWDKELEADRFAGAVIKAMEMNSMTTLNDALGSARSYLSKFPSATHPPRDLRIQAALEGYNNGSPCIGRNIETGSASTSSSHSIAGPGLWHHNGSSMKLLANGSTRKFMYVEPRAGLDSVGIREGSVAFEGTRTSEGYSGTAYVYSSKCGRLGFPVSGPVATDQRSVTMHGKAPVRSAADCRTREFRDETLIFTFSGS